MDRIRIEGIDGHDGEYELDTSYFTNREFHTIKRLTGLRVGELDDAFRTSDSDLLVALAVIALQRHGREFDEDMIWDAQAGKITFVGEPDADPPAPSEPASGSA